MKRAAILMGAVLLLMTPMLIVSGAQSLHIRTETGALLWCAPVRANDLVQLQFTHSMFGGYVREQWHVTPDNRLNRVRFVTENAAAAEYYATDGSSYRDDDGFVVPGAPLQETGLVIRVDHRGNHRLTVGDHIIHLAEELPGSTQVRISVELGSCKESHWIDPGKDD